MLMSTEEKWNLDYALSCWRFRSRLQRWSWYGRKGFSGAACDAFYDELILLHEEISK